MSEASSKSKPIYTCEYCNKEFIRSCWLKEHRRVHTGERPFKCHLCDYASAGKNTLTVHIRRHLQERPFKCPEDGCPFSSATSTHVTRHRKTVHLGEKRFQCPIPSCDSKFTRNQNLVEHMKTHKEPEAKKPVKPFQCSLCPFKTAIRRCIWGHMKHLHSEERRFKCPEEGCNYAGKTTSLLKMHREYHGEKGINCPHPNCEYRTNSKRCLKSHVKIHSLESEKKYKCRFCTYSFHHLHGLTLHMRTHTKEMPYKCKVKGCPHETNHPSSLKQHVKDIHEKIGGFKCSFCPYKVAYKGMLKNHEIKWHSSDNTKSQVKAKVKELDSNLPLKS